MKILIETKNYKAAQYSDKIEIFAKADENRIIERVSNTDFNIKYAIRYAERLEKFNY